jgi:hypothetical protein
MAKSKYAKVGQSVTVGVPRAFVRCGYPLTYEIIIRDQAEKVKSLVDPLAQLLFKSAYYTKPKSGLLSLRTVSLEDINPRAKRYLENAVCCVLLNQQGFGGKKRDIYEEDEDKHFPFDWEWKLEKKTFVKTGTYFPPSGGEDSFSGEIYYEEGGLNDMETHCVYHLDSHGRKFITLARNCSWPTSPPPKLPRRTQSLILTAK